MKTASLLREEVIEELNARPSLSPAAIGVAVENGVVTLSGYVDNFVQKREASEAAKHVTGVRGLADEIEVRLPGLNLRSDSDIANAAQTSMEWNVSIPRNQVQVTVENGWVTLTGSVSAYYQRMAAETTVRPLMGVRGLSNQILVQPSPAAAADVRERIISALARNALVEASRIRVLADGGRVTLEGSVHSWAERDAVSRAAWAAKGVTEVVNHLEVGLAD